MDIAHLRSNRWLWARIVAVLSLGAVAMWCLFTLADTQGGELATGVYIGTMGMAIVHGLRESSGSAPRHRGADSEIFVHETLRTKVPKGWTVRSAVTFADGDIDHIIVGDTMVIAVETKATSTTWKLTEQGVALNHSDPTAQARRALGRARRLVAGGASAGIDGAAWLVIESPPLPDRDALLPTRRGDVTVTRIRDLATLATALPPIVDPERAAANLARLDTYLASRRTHDDRTPAAPVKTTRNAKASSR